MIPADTVSFNDASRISILRQINGCETEGKLLNTHVVDQLLSVFNSNTCFIFPTYSTVSGNMSPYYGRFRGKSRLDDAVELIVLPLCDGSHFNGYIVDLVNKHIVCVDSMYQPKYRKRSIGAKLRDTYFDAGVDITYTTYFEQRVQGDGHSCGAWMVVGMVAHILKAEEYGSTLTREKVFNIMVILIENIGIAEKRGNILNLFHHNNPASSKHIIDAAVEKEAYEPKIDDTSDDEEKEEIFEHFTVNMKNVSTPQKRCDPEEDLIFTAKKAKVNFIEEIFDDDDDFSVINEPIPDLSMLSSDDSLHEHAKMTSKTVFPLTA